VRDRDYSLSRNYYSLFDDQASQDNNLWLLHTGRGRATTRQHGGQSSWIAFNFWRAVSYDDWPSHYRIAASYVQSH